MKYDIPRTHESAPTHIGPFNIKGKDYKFWLTRNWKGIELCYQEDSKIPYPVGRPDEKRHVLPTSPPIDDNVIDAHIAAIKLNLLYEYESYDIGSYRICFTYLFFVNQSTQVICEVTSSLQQLSWEYFNGDPYEPAWDANLFYETNQIVYESEKQIKDTLRDIKIERKGEMINIIKRDMKEVENRLYNLESGF